MRAFDEAVIARHEAGEVDYVDALAFYFDSGVAAFYLGGRGQFDWDGVTYHGGGALISIEAAEEAFGPEAKPVTVRLNTTYIPEGSDLPVNVFDDGLIATINDENWQHRVAVISVFHRAASGEIIEREQIDVRVIDQVLEETDEDGNPTLVAILELPDIAQRDIEGKTRNHEFQRQIDPDDRALEHAASTSVQEINFGRVKAPAK